MKNGTRAAIPEEEMMNRRLIGVRRTRRIKRVLLAAVVFVGIFSFWQISRRNSEIIESESLHNAEEQGRQRVDVTKGNGNFDSLNDVTREYTNNAFRNKTIETGADDTGDEVTQKPPNQVTTKSNKTNTSLPGDTNADVDEKEKHINNTKFAPNIESTDNNGNVQADDLKTAKMDAVNNNKSSELNIHEDREKVETGEVDKQTSVENNAKIGSNNTPIDESPNAVKDIKLEGSMISTEKENNTDTVSKSIDLSRYNYSEPRYSVSQNGQFEFMKFVTEKVNISFSQSLRNSSFSYADKVYLTLLSQGQIREIYSIRHHQNLRLVAFDAPTVYHDAIPIESCPLCAAIKGPKDINEILAFHVDRTLGIERALPATGRKFVQEELDNLGFEEANTDDVFPVMWFAKDLIHGGTFQKDQNSIQLSWKRYQDILADCQDRDGTSNSSHVINCTDIYYSDWSRMAVLDFVMQNHDRLDRYCCGYDTNEGEACFKNEILNELESCDDVDHRFLVHILTSKNNPHQLILLDNGGNIQRSSEHLNYELLKGIRSIPKTVMKNIYSEDLKDRLRSSLKLDAVYWTITEDDVIDKLVEAIIQRVEKLKSYITEHSIMTI